MTVRNVSTAVRRRRSPIARVSALVAALLATAAPSPAQNPPIDADQAALPQVPIPGNGTHRPRNGNTTRPALTIRVPVTLGPGNYLVQNPGDQECDLVVEAGGHLRVEGAEFRVRGNIYLKEGGVLEFEDTVVSLVNGYPKEFGYWWEGGHLHTHRVLIGGWKRPENAGIQVSAFWLNRGMWTAQDTTVQYSGGILLGLGRVGFQDDPFLRGGTLYADGLHQGEAPDAVIMSGMGDAVLENSVFNVNVRLYADNQSPFGVDLDVSSETIVHDVYGDAAVHDALDRPAVTKHIPGSPYRLELTNVVVPFWFVNAYEVSELSQGAQPAVFTLHNATNLAIAFVGNNLTSSPQAVGPWGNFYAPPFPQLPSTGAPGQHGIPPGCGVQIANVTFAAPPSASIPVTGWGISLDGTGTNLRLRAPFHLNELNIIEGSVTIDGTDQYDAGVLANTVNLHRDARLTMRNVAIGSYDRLIAGQILLHGIATCDIQNSLVRNLTVQTKAEPYAGPFRGVDAATIKMRDFIERTPLRELRSPGGTFDIRRATAAESFDLTNVDFEQPVRGNGLPSYWSGSAVNGYASTSARPGSPGARSFGYRSSNSNGGELHKDLALCPGSRVQVSGWVRGVTLPAGSFLQIDVSGSAGIASVRPPVAADQWLFFQVPLYEVSTADPTVRVRISHGVNQPGFDVLVDDLDVRVVNWWEVDNVENLDFEEGYRSYGTRPGNYRAPDFWEVWTCQTSRETGDLRAGAMPGSSAMRMVVVGSNQGVVGKRLTHLPPGPNRTLVVKCWAKVLRRTPGTYFKLAIGDGNTWWQSGVGNNVLVDLSNASAWQQFTLHYTMPNSPTFTRVAITGGGPDDIILVDDMEITVQ